ncbi:MAG TPA: hypothetical protein VFY40_16355, partial [Blastocatellia bacterium]|nr:hypothetical protein [Blastocatellia bacterium]
MKGIINDFHKHCAPTALRSMSFAFEVAGKRPERQRSKSSAATIFEIAGICPATRVVTRRSAEVATVAPKTAESGDYQYRPT